MKKALHLLIIAVCIVTAIVIGISMGKSNTIPIPDQISVHNGEVTVIMDKSDLKDQINIFKKFTNLVNGRIIHNISTAQDIINNSEIENLKKNPIWVEFSYSNEKEMHITGDGFQPFKYTKLFFVLESTDGNKENYSIVNTLQYGDSNGYKDCSRGPLKYSQKLVDYAKTFKVNKKGGGN